MTRHRPPPPRTETHPTRSRTNPAERKRKNISQQHFRKRLTGQREGVCLEFFSESESWSEATSEANLTKIGNSKAAKGRPRPGRRRSDSEPVEPGEAGEDERRAAKKATPTTREMTTAAARFTFAERHSESGRTGAREDGWWKLELRDRGQASVCGFAWCTVFCPQAPSVKRGRPAVKGKPGTGPTLGESCLTFWPTPCDHGNAHPP